jgi:hypothetical protein
LLTRVSKQAASSGPDHPSLASDAEAAKRYFGSVAEEAAGGFLGTLDTGIQARLFVCRRPGCD